MKEDVVLWKLLGKKLWAFSDRIKDKAAFEESISRSLREHTRTISG